MRVKGAVEHWFDVNMKKFHTITSIASDQVLRYSRWDVAGPLWMSTQHLLKPNEIPNCHLCGGPRCFEFQIMPQLLHALRPHEIGDDSVFSIHRTILQLPLNRNQIYRVYL